MPDGARLRCLRRARTTISGEVLVAAIEPAPGPTPTAEQIREFLEPRIARFKIPRRITFHDVLPREDRGKILKRRLREPYWAQAGRRI
jgi:long-chain acyl-CoA synthetase